MLIYILLCTLISFHLLYSNYNMTTMMMLEYMVVTLMYLLLNISFNLVVLILIISAMNTVVFMISMMLNYYYYMINFSAIKVWMYHTNSVVMCSVL